jgi:hypothetical protein
MRFLILFTLCITTCIKQPAQNHPEHDQFKPGVVVGSITNSELDEISGLAASVGNPGCFWVHNDSGDDARVFLIDTIGNTIVTVNLAGISNRDWEDITIGPGPLPGASYIYIAETGDNAARHNYKSVFRFKEPIISTQETNQSITIANVDVITFQYEDGRRDAETLMIDQIAKDLYIVSKREDSVRVYMLPYPQSLVDTIVVESQLQLPFSMATGGDISADGFEILIKNYQKVYYWKREPDETIISALSKVPAEMPYIIEQQGEAISWLRNGQGYVTVSEAGFGKSDVGIYFYKRK